MSEVESSPSLLTRLDLYFSLRHPWLPAAKLYVATVWRNLRSGNFRAASGDESFAQWWLAASHNFVDFENSTPVPTLVSKAYGTVLDLGAGSGNQLPRFDADKLDRVYGIEFNPTLIPALNDKIKETGLEDIYTPLVCRVEDADKALEQEGVEAGSVDSIVCIQLLCSVDDLTAVVKKLHGLLKPGGEFIFWEHQEHETDWMTRMAQGFWNLLWSPVIGHCKLNSPTRKKLLAAVDWEVIELGEDVEGPLDLMPRVWGRLKKKSRD